MYYRKGTQVTLDFDFPFYGHPVRELWVLPGGFISVPSIKHANFVQTQYIAPLMADFDTR